MVRLEHVLDSWKSVRESRAKAMTLVTSTKERELSHGAKLFVYLRLKGIVPATTRRRLAKAKA